ncbi:hypothetical protein [Aeromonas salmonicida]|uniref:hypothetical protein n=1 Tax=Aeromonas salmonicida TaxID=645 RepID=UPI003D323E9C
MPFMIVGAGSGTGGGSLAVANELRFKTTTERDSYFVAHADKLKDETIVLVGDAGKEQLFQYREQDKKWIEITAAIVGPKGDRGIDLKVQYSKTGVDQWVNVYSKDQKFIRFSNDDGNTWTESARFRSEEIIYEYSINGTGSWDKVLASTHRFARVSINSGETFSIPFRINADKTVFQYGESELGPWGSKFDRVNTPWCRVSIDGGITFDTPFRIVAQDGLSFTVQYSASDLGPWTSFFNDGVHEFFRFSNDNGATWTPAQRFKAVPFGVNSEDRNVIDIGGHKIVSANEQIAYHNIFTGDNFYPVWQGVSRDGSEIYRAGEVMFSPRENRVPLNGAITDKVVDYNFVRAYSRRMALFAMEFKPAEEYTGDIKFQIWSQAGNTLIYSMTIRNAVLKTDSDFRFSYLGNLFVQPGNILNIRIIKADGEPVKAFAGSEVGSEPWRLIDLMPMEAVQIINKRDGKDVARMLETLTDTDRLSINALKDVDGLKTGSFRGPIDFAKGINQFIPATKNDYWRSDREINYQGVSFKVGDKLVIMRNIAETETFGNIVDQSVFYLERNLANVAKPTEVGIVKPGHNTQVDAAGALTVKKASAEQEGAVKLGVAGGAARLGEDGKISTEQLPPIDTVRRVTIANEAARLALPPSNRFTIAIQMDNQNQYYLDPNMLASFKGNWIPAGSIAAAVTSFKDRTGKVEPQAGDYTAEMVDAVGLPASDDGKRRVLIGRKLVEEKKGDEFIKDSVTAIEYKIVIEGGVVKLRPVNTEEV